MNAKVIATFCNKVSALTKETHLKSFRYHFAFEPFVKFKTNLLINVVCKYTLFRIW